MGRNALASIAIFASLVTISNPSLAAQLEGADLADAQCVAFVALIGASKDADAKPDSGMAGSMMYFIGKIRGRNIKTPISDVLSTEVFASIGANNKDIADRCGQELISLGGEMKNVGAALGTK